MSLPDVKKNLHVFDKDTQPSDLVLCRALGWADMQLARYYHGEQLKEWRLTCDPNNAATVLEWWPLPELGSGRMP